MLVLKFSLNIKVIGIQFVVQCRICHSVTFSLLKIKVEVLNEHLSMLVGRFDPTKVVRVGNKDKPWFDDQCGHAFSMQEAHLRWTRDRSWVNWEEFVGCQVRANETYSDAYESV